MKENPPPILERIAPLKESQVVDKSAVNTEELNILKLEMLKLSKSKKELLTVTEFKTEMQTID